MCFEAIFCRQEVASCGILDTNEPERLVLMNVGTYGPFCGSRRSVKSAKNAAAEVALQKLEHLVDPLCTLQIFFHERSGKYCIY